MCFFLQLYNYMHMCLCFCVVGHPRVRVCPESAGAASTEALWKEEEPGGQPHPGRLQPHSVHTFMNNLLCTSCLFSRPSLCVSVSQQKHERVFCPFVADECAGNVSECMYGWFPRLSCCKTEGVSLRTLIWVSECASTCVSRPSPGCQGS